MENKENTKLKIDLYKTLQKLQENYIYSMSPQTIYHYTSVDGLEGILFNRDNTCNLWFSRTDLLNDTNEGLDVIERYHELLNKYFEAGLIDKHLYKAIYNLQTENKSLFLVDNNGKLNLKKCDVDVYCCSFSKNRDALPMWNYYSKGDHYLGYNVGIPSESLKYSLAKNDKKDYRFFIVKLIYDDAEKEKILKELIDKIIFLNKKFSSKNAADNFFKDFIPRFLNEFRFIFKNNAFVHEEEVRALIYVPKGAVLSKVLGEEHYRNKDEYLIPYYVCKFERDFPVEICIGPSSNKENLKIKKEILKKRIENSGYKNSDVSFSKIPVRY